jgi:hypothetical protein
MLMETILEVTNQGTPFQREPYVFPYFGNIGPTYIATLNLPGFTLGLPIWLIFTPLAMNAPTTA